MHHSSDHFKFKQYLEAVNEKLIVYETDPEGKITFVNRTFEEHFGFSSLEILGKKPSTFKNPNTPQSHITQLWETILAQKVFCENITNTTKSGEDIHLNQTIVPLVSLDGSTYGYVAFSYDITELTNYKNTLRATLEGVSNLVVLTDSHQLIDINQSALDFLGYEDIGQFLQQHRCICELFVHKEGYGGMSDWEEIVRTYTTPHQFRVCMLDLIGKEHYFELEIKKIPESDKFIAIFTDITSYTQLRSQEEIQKERLISMGEMVANIAHQWRQPLSSISSLLANIKLSIALGDLNQEDLYEDVKRIDTTVQYLSDTISTFRNFLKRDKSHQLVVLGDVIEEAIGFSKFVLNKHQIELIVATIDATLRVYTIKNELIQVFLNIINNAKDALMQSDIENKTIHVLTKKSFHEVHIYIKDNAGGIPQNLLQRIFEPYFTTKHQAQGTGLGLSMSLAIVESMGGKIVANNGHKGAIFEIILPIHTGNDQ